MSLALELRPGGAGGGAPRKIDQTALRSRGGESAKRTLDGEDGALQWLAEAAGLDPLLRRFGENRQAPRPDPSRATRNRLLCSLVWSRGVAAPCP